MPAEQPLHQPAGDVDAASDRDLVTSVMNVLTSPPAAEADSFVLHAPLELVARTELLPSVTPSQRDEARRRLSEIAADWTSRTPHVPLPSERPTTSLPDAIAGGDVDAADRALVDLAAHETTGQFVATAGDALLAHLGGAGHLAIFLAQLSRWPRAPRGVIAAARALVRDLAQHPDWSITWVDRPSRRVDRPTHSFVDVLADAPSAGDPGSDFIYPTMHLVDANGMAAELLTGPAATTPLEDARRQLLRIAASSMLHDDPNRAPYGWSHCLTMPQAALAVAPYTSDPARAIAVAATYVLGFRATLSTTGVDLGWQPARVRSDRPDRPLLDADVDHAVARAWHTEQPDRVERELATYAATHHDAHLAKYTLACLHAAHDDPDAAPLYRAAATRLALWWRDHDTRAADEDHDGG